MKKILPVVAASLVLVMALGAGLVLASGSVELAELELRGDGEVRVQGAEVFSIDEDMDMFDILVQGIPFTVHVMAGADLEDFTLADLIAGDLVDLRGMLDMDDHHLIHADEVGVEFLELEEEEEEL